MVGFVLGLLVSYWFSRVRMVVLFCGFWMVVIGLWFVLGFLVVPVIILGFLRFAWVFGFGVGWYNILFFRVFGLVGWLVWLLGWVWGMAFVVFRCCVCGASVSWLLFWGLLLSC